MTLPPLNPETTPAGIAVDPKTLERVVPATRRADGTVRKELKIRPGFTPQEDAARFKTSHQQNSEQNALPKGHIVGWVAPSSETRPKRGGRAGPSTTGARSLEALASGNIGIASTVDTPVSKSAKKNAKRSEKKKEEKQKTLEEKIKAAWDDDSEEDIPRPAKKGKGPASSSTPKTGMEPTLAAEETTQAAEKPGDDTAEVSSKVAELNI